MSLPQLIQKLNLNQKPVTNSNSSLKKFIVQKDTREAAESLIRCVSDPSLDNDQVVKHAKYFLVGYLIFSCPQQVLDDPFTPIYFLAKRMMLTDFEMAKISDPSCQSIFKATLDHYLTAYAKWLEDDREQLATHLLIQYYDLDNTIDELTHTKEPESRTEIQQHLEASREQIRSRLDQIYSLHLIDKWNQEVKKGKFTKRQIIYYLKSTTLTGFEYYGDPTEIIGKQAFWDYFTDTFRIASQNAPQIESKLASEDLAKIEHANQLIYSTIEEFKTLIKNLVPNRLDLAQFYDENLDTEYIKHLVDGQVFKPENLNQLVKYSMEQLQSLGSEQDSQDIARWLEKWEIIYSCRPEMSEVLPYVLRDLINKTERITGLKKLFLETSNPN